jgi:hypothetical protein
MGGALEFHRRLRPPAGALDGSREPACMGRLLNQPLAGVTVRKLPMSWPSSRSPSIALALARSGRPRLVTPRYRSPVFRFRRHPGWAGRCVPVPPAPTRQAAPQTALDGPPTALSASASPAAANPEKNSSVPGLDSFPWRRRRRRSAACLLLLPIPTCAAKRPGNRRGCFRFRPWQAGGACRVQAGQI